MPLVRDHIEGYPETIPFTKQGVEVPGTKKPGQTGHYRNGVWGLLTRNTPNALTTITEIYDSGMRVGKDAPFLGRRPLISTNPVKYAPYYEWQTWGQVDHRRRCVGSALSLLFKTGKLGGAGELETVGIWAMNRPEWQIVDLAIATYGKVDVSIYDTLGKDAVEYIINHSHVTSVFTSADHIPTLLKLKPKIPMLKAVVSMDDFTAETRTILTQWGWSVGVHVMDMKEFEAIGEANLIEPIPATPDQLVSICYTSGTTSNPKGAMLTHGMLALSVQANLYGLNLPDEGSTMSYLPLAHIYERITELATISTGAKIGYFSGDPLRLIEDCQILKPSLFPSVPRVLNRVYQAAMLAGDVPGLKGALFRKAIQAKMEKLHATGDNTHFFWDKLVFRKIQAVLGGNLVLVTCGSAPIHGEVLDFLKIALACDVLEGYGMTENCGTCTKCWPFDPSASGTVGPPQSVTEIKLIDVPSMNYTSEDKPRPRGELCARGENIMKKYHKDEKNTQEAVDEEGWLHTGDVAEIDDFGRVRIIDRVKNIMKLAQGEYVAVEKIENTYSSSAAVAQLFVHGDSLQSYLVGVVIPDPLHLSAIASRLSSSKVTPDDVKSLGEACKQPEVVKEFVNILDKEAKKGGLKGFETLKRIHLSLDPFSVEDGTLTPTFKIKRKDAYEKFKAELDALYSLGEPGAGSKL
ncbi:long-chain-fatty-acid-CoA ligase [Lentinula edodes]|uniref:Long-chain-fatty-acid-CoA ligase n=1 Tax=Lentinula lateritia TaxID=40482 RepID=A0A9W8ZUQ2_9AGAR|nr:long-chain-fatty-acid-CoA ligase [Lentinula edodes]